jgi:fatty acid desaturase
MLADTSTDDAAVASAAMEGFRPPASLLRDETDARRYTRSTLACVCLLYAALGLALASVLPVWLLLVVVPLVYFRLALALHELLHVCPAEEVPRFHRLTMIFESPLCLGYREHRAIHFAHHRFASTERDPELYQIVGGPWRGFINAMVSPERAFVGWVRQHGITRSLAVEAAIRLIGFLTVLAINPAAFLAYWLMLRISVGVASFVFHHVVHSLDGRLGTFPLAVSARVVRAAGAIFGREALLILTEHARHHQWPRMRAKNLPLLPEPRA